MSNHFDELEYSIENAESVNLYEFTVAEKAFRYTNADSVINAVDAIWQPIAISDSGVNMGADTGVEITLPATTDIAQLFRGLAPSEPIKIKLYRLQQDDFRVIWMGTIYEAKRESAHLVKLISQSIVKTFTQSGLRLTYSRSCPYSLYDKQCRVDKTLHRHRANIVGLDGLTLTLDIQMENGWFSGGFIEWDNDGFTERRGIQLHEDNHITLYGGTARLEKNGTIWVYPGCARTIDVCSKKFNNHLNYGGMPHMPGVSPYTIMKLF